MLKKILNVCGIICLVMLSLFVYHSYFQKKVAYVDIPKVFNSFEMKKELQEKFKKTATVRKRIVDSLEFDLQVLSRKLQADQKNQTLITEFDLKREYYFKQKEQIEQDNAAMSNQFDKQILERMSQYMIDYGKENNYDLILGADGNGVLMYANEGMNISDDVSKYVNNKYKGVE